MPHPLNLFNLSVLANAIRDYEVLYEEDVPYPTPKPSKFLIAAIFDQKTSYEPDLEQLSSDSYTMREPTEGRICSVS